MVVVVDQDFPQLKAQFVSSGVIKNVSKLDWATNLGVPCRGVLVRQCARNCSMEPLSVPVLSLDPNTGFCGAWLPA